jgi:hypothetical protein
VFLTRKLGPSTAAVYGHETHSDSSDSSVRPWREQSSIVCNVKCNAKCKVKCRVKCTSSLSSDVMALLPGQPSWMVELKCLSQVT